MGDHLISACTDTQQQKCELLWKTTYWEKKFLSCSFYLYRFRKYLSYGFPIINFCNLGVHYETLCTLYTLSETADWRADLSSRGVCVTECNLQTSTVRRPGSEYGCCATTRNTLKIADWPKVQAM
jgi:hypothetical protein